MATVLFRLEKTTEDNKVLYIEFQREANNAVTRLWNRIGANGLSVASKERENFSGPAGVETYIKNARKQYEGQGFHEPGKGPAKPPTPPAPVLTGATAETGAPKKDEQIKLEE